MTLHRVSSYYDTVLCKDSGLWCIIQLKMIGESPGAEVLTTLNLLSVIRLWNFGSTWANANGDSDLALYNMVIY